MHDCTAPKGKTAFAWHCSAQRSICTQRTCHCCARSAWKLHMHSTCQNHERSASMLREDTLEPKKHGPLASLVHKDTAKSRESQGISPSVALYINMKYRQLNRAPHEYRALHSSKRNEEILACMPQELPCCLRGLRAKRLERRVLEQTCYFTARGFTLQQQSRHIPMRQKDADFTLCTSWCWLGEASLRPRGSSCT